MGRRTDLEMMLGEPKKAIRSLAVPLSLSYLVIQVNMFVDMFWISGLGDRAATAVALMAPIYYIVSACGVGLGVGASSTIAFRLGEGNRGRADKIASNSIVLGLFLSVLVSAVIGSLVEPIIALFGAQGLDAECKGYVLPFILMASALIVNGIVAGLLRAEGAGRKSMTVLVIAAFLNVFLDPVFIYFLGWGVAGAGWATSIGALISTMLGFYWYSSRKMEITLSFKGYRPDRGAMSEVLGIGGPKSLEAVTFNVVNVLQRFPIIVAGGLVAVMLYSLPWRYIMFCVVAAESIGAAMIPVCSAAMGQRDTARMRSGMLYSAKLTAGILVVLSVLLIAFADPLMSVFTFNDSMKGHKEELVWVLRMLAILMTFDGMRRIGSCMLQVERRSKLSAKLTLLFGVNKLACYSLVCTISFHALMYSAIVAHVIGGIIPIAIAWHIAKRIDDEHIPKEPGAE